MKISAVILHGGEYGLKECINHLVNKVDEIVVVNSSGIDLGINEENIRVFEYVWENDFSKARNFGINKSTGDWIIMVDTDERLDISCNIREVLSNLDSNIGGLTIGIDGHATVVNFRNTMNLEFLIGMMLSEYDNGLDIEYIGSKYFIESDSIRIFRNRRDFRYSGNLHEMIGGCILSNGYKIIRSNLMVHHLGYDITVDKMGKKILRNIRLAIDEVRRESSGISWFNLGYSIVYLSSEIADKCFDRALEYDGLGTLEGIIYYNKGNEYRRKAIDNPDLWIKTIEYFNKALDINPNNIQAEVALAVCEYEIYPDEERTKKINEYLENPIYRDLIRYYL